MARKSGFAAWGVATAHASPHREHLEAWLGEGRQGSLGWMAHRTDLRSDPRLLLEGCRSVIVFADSVRRSPDPGGKLVARYAHGRDYHRILEKRLKRIVATLREAAPEASFRITSDVQPILEHYWAERAGVGWIGKNSLTITRAAGSQVVLGEILTTLSLPVDEPASFHCGTCRACLDACPVDAIVAPGKVDAARCLSAVTVEHKGPFTADQKASLGGHLLGCDDCQDVCPWNRDPKPGILRPEEYTDRNVDLLSGGPKAFRTADEAEFRARFAGTAFARPGREGVERTLDALEGP